MRRWGDSACERVWRGRGGGGTAPHSHTGANPAVHYSSSRGVRRAMPVGSRLLCLPAVRAVIGCRRGVSRTGVGGSASNASCVHTHSFRIPIPHPLPATPQHTHSPAHCQQCSAHPRARASSVRQPLHRTRHCACLAAERGLLCPRPQVWLRLQAPAPRRRVWGHWPPRTVGRTVSGRRCRPPTGTCSCPLPCERRRTAVWTDGGRGTRCVRPERTEADGRERLTQRTVQQMQGHGHHGGVSPPRQSEGGRHVSDTPGPCWCQHVCPDSAHSGDSQCGCQ